MIMFSKPSLVLGTIVFIQMVYKHVCWDLQVGQLQALKRAKDDGNHILLIE
jgi:hypothetical protein